MTLSKLTEEQEKYLEIVKEKFIALALNTDDINKKTTEEYIKLIYSFDKLPKPKIIYVDSPIEVQAFLNLYNYVKINKIKSKITDEIVKKIISNNSEFYSLSYYSDLTNYCWLSFFSYFKDIGILKNELFDKYLDLFISSNIYQFAKLPEYCIVCRKPISILRDNLDRLHSYKFPAVEWKNGFKQYFIKGLEVPSSWVEDKITLEDIDNQNNVELRRIALEIYGYKNYFQNKNAELIAQDEYGELYKLKVPDDEPIVMVSMLNCSPEPGYEMGLEQREEFRKTEIVNRGAWYKRYLQRVPPTIKTPVEGLAWGAGKTVEEYINNMIFES